MYNIYSILFNALLKILVMCNVYYNGPRVPMTILYIIIYDVVVSCVIYLPCVHYNGKLNRVFYVCLISFELFKYTRIHSKCTYTYLLRRYL